MSRIVQASNLDLDWFNEEFILWPMPFKTCTTIADAINYSNYPGHAYWYKVVDNDYELYIGMQT